MQKMYFNFATTLYEEIRYKKPPPPEVELYWGYRGGMRINKKVSGRVKPDTFLIKGGSTRRILKAL